MACLLCREPRTGSPYFENAHHRFWHCQNCGTVYRDPATFPDPKDEKARYLEHNNDPEDPGYQGFVRPLVQQVMDHLPAGSSGLDYGAGTGPVAAKLLREAGYGIALYDPFFHPDRSVLNERYDFIVACEVIEHFHQPLDEFERLYALLAEGGSLFCMTDPLSPGVDFAKWYYKDDPTHVLFYNTQNLEWIRRKAGFKTLEVEGRVIRLER